MDMEKIMEQARIMQQQLMDAQDNMAGIEVSATAGGGMVNVSATADMRLTSISIDPAVVDAFTRFMREHGGGTPAETLAKQFGNTYWYYYFYRLGV